MTGLMQTLYSKRRNLILSFVLVLASTFVITLTLINSQNNLYKNKFWTPFRASFFGLLSGGIESLLSRQPVAGNKLRTHHQRVFSKESLDPKMIEFKFRLNHEGTFVEVLFNADEAGYEALRISHEKHNPLFHYRALHSGKIEWRKNLIVKSPLVLPLSAKLEEKENKLFFTVYGETYQVDSSLREGKIGFDLSADATIWDPVVTKEDGSTISAPFKSEENFWKIYFFNLGFVFLVFLIIRRPVTITLLILTFHLFDNFFYSKQTFTFNRAEKTFNSFPYNYEHFRFQYFHKWYRLASGNTDESVWNELEKINVVINLKLRYCHDDVCTSELIEDIPPKQQDSFRIMVWGGSMTVGSGLLKQEDSYPEILHKKLQNLYKGKVKIETLNASRMLKTFDQYHGYLFRDVETFKPDLLIIDAFIWDDSIQNYEKTLPHLKHLVPKLLMTRIPFNYDRNTFLTRNEHLGLLKKGLQPVPSPKSAFLKYDPKLLEWKRKYAMEFMDPNLSLLTDQVYFGGQLFWDAIHITQYGHEQWANYIFENIRPYILK